MKALGRDDSIKESGRTREKRLKRKYYTTCILRSKKGLSEEKVKSKKGENKRRMSVVLVIQINIPDKIHHYAYAKKVFASSLAIKLEVLFKLLTL